MLPAPLTRLKLSGHVYDEQNLAQHCLSSHLLSSHCVVDASGIWLRPFEQPIELQYTTCATSSERERGRMKRRREGGRVGKREVHYVVKRGVNMAGWRARERVSDKGENRRENLTSGWQQQREKKVVSGTSRKRTDGNSE